MGVGGTIGTNLFSNDLIAKTEYPDPTTGDASTDATNDVSSTYDLLGEKMTATDQNATTHTFNLDILGRTTADIVTALGSGVDGTILRLGYNFNGLGMPYQQTSYSDTSGTTIVNQIQDDYNGLGQLVTMYQAHSGSVSSSGVPVSYNYSE
jgi:hypothetical protein